MATRSRRTGFLSIAAILVGALALQGCSSSPDGDDLLGAVKAGKVLTIGTSNDPPWSSVTGGGDAVGIIPDILREYAKRADMPDVKVESTAMPFDSLIPSITSGRIQMIGDAMYATAKRAETVQFSRVLFYNTEALVVAKGNPKNLQSIPDLCGNVGATYKGTSWVDDLNNASTKCPGGKSITVKTYTTVDQVMQDIANGRVDGGLIDSSLAAYAISQNPDLKIELADKYVPLDREKSNNALGIKLTDKTFMASFNKIYTEMLADGTVAKIFEKNGLVPAKVFLPES